MKKRALSLSIAAAAIGMGAFMGGGQSVVAEQTVEAQRIGNQQPLNNQRAPIGARTMFGLASGGGGWRPPRPSYRGFSGYGVAEGKRRALKTRNRLRSRGRFRDAVR